MATLAKSATGLLLYDNMNVINTYWTISPVTGDRVVVNGKGEVEMEHGDARVSMLISAPTGDYVFEAEIEHKPASLSDTGGILVYSDSINSIELQSFFSGNAGTNQYYKHIKAIKEGDRYEFRASKDNVIWELCGKSLLQDSHMIGFFLDGQVTETSKKLTIKKMAFYRSNTVCFVGVPSSAVIKVYDEAMEEKLSLRASVYTSTSSGGKILVNLDTLPMPINFATIRIIDNEMVINEKQFNSFAGGDIYNFTYDIEVWLNDQPIYELVDLDLGFVGSGGQINRLTILNKDTVPLVGRTIKVTSYSEYYRGSKFAKVALVDSSGIEISSYESEMIIPSIPAGGRLDLSLKIDRDASTEAPFFNKEYKFKILIE